MTNRQYQCVFGRKNSFFLLRAQLTTLSSTWKYYLIAQLLCHEKEIFTQESKRIVKEDTSFFICIPLSSVSYSHKSLLFLFLRWQLYWSRSFSRKRISNHFRVSAKYHIFRFRTHTSRRKQQHHHVDGFSFFRRSRCFVRWANYRGQACRTFTHRHS